MLHMNNDTTEFSFDEWAELTKHDPQAFESKREGTLRALLHQTPAIDSA